MAAIQDSEYVKLCAQLARLMLSRLASARRQVDQAAAREGKRDLEGRRAMAQSMLTALDSNDEGSVERLTALLSSSEGDGNFILED